jgi:hypothetical protein
VGEAYAHVLRAPYARPAASTYPVPVALVIDPQAGEAVARFRVSPDLQYQRDTNAPQGRVYLKDYNARDFGFHYLALDAGRSTNVSQSAPVRSRSFNSSIAAAAAAIRAGATT